MAEEGPIEITLDELASIAEGAALLLGGTARVIVQVSGLLLRGAGDIVHALTARDLEEARRARELGTAAGRAAWLASHQNFVRLCRACGTPINDCRAAGGHCCERCEHPLPTESQ